MKYLLVLLFCFSAQASYIKVDDYCSENKWTAYSRCPKGATCYKVKEGHSCETHHVVNEIVDDPDKPVFSKNEVEACVAIEDDPVTIEVDESVTLESSCNEKHAMKTCIDVGEYSVIAEDYSEVYCTKLLRHEKKLTGRQVVVIDEVKKAANDIKVSKKESRRNKINNGSQRRLKCSDALSYISGDLKDLTEEQVDTVMAQFQSVHVALKDCSTKKAKRLLGLVDDPLYNNLRDELLIILE